MLPHFPKSYRELSEIRNAQIFDAMFSVSPILSQIGIRAQREGRKSSFQDEQGNIRPIDYKPVSIPVKRKIKEARGMSMKEFINMAREAGDGMGKAMMQSLYANIDKVTSETGNVVDTGGKPITYDLLLKLLDKMQINFGVDGNPVWPSLNLGSEAYAHVQKEYPGWLNDPDFKKRLSTIVERKREEFYEREACRRLVD